MSWCNITSYSIFDSTFSGPTKGFLYLPNRGPTKCRPGHFTTKRRSHDRFQLQKDRPQAPDHFVPYTCSPFLFCGNLQWSGITKNADFVDYSSWPFWGWWFSPIDPYGISSASLHHCIASPHASPSEDVLDVLPPPMTAGLVVHSDFYTPEIDQNRGFTNENGDANMI